ncbi:probable cytochrome P450 4ac1 [Folsomia candida]|uniref:probable cytochrome P450 4ac1 n=1 Tax=Folsomia candida TaxID=158441 RepID=UPI001604BF8D|nr:probable cytochrome P450 4ac1 [Folsomia candida]
MNADFLQVFHHQLKYLMAVLEEKCVTGEEFHIDGMFGKFTTGAGFTTILDWPVPINIFDKKSLPGFYEAFQTAAHLAGHPVVNLWFSFRPLWHLAGYEKKMRLAFATMRKYLNQELLQEKMAHWKEYEKNGVIQERMKCMNILYTKCTDPDEIFHQILNILAAAVDSTDFVLCEAFIFLAQNPDIQKKAYEEARRVIGDNYDVVMRSEDVSRLTYIAMVLKETMRIIPPVPALVRKVMEEMDVGNGLVIPKNTNVFIPLLTVHHDPKVYPKPGEFIPERFLPENVLNRHRYSYLPFSAGERICIGEKYVMPQMKFVVAKILYKYEILTKMKKPLEKTEVQYMPFSKYKDGLSIQLKRRLA